MNTIESFNHFYSEITYFERNINSNKLIGDAGEENILDTLDFKECENNILSVCDSIVDSLEEYHVLSDEYYDFLEIQDMIEHILNYDSFEEITEYELEFLNNILNDFHKIITKRYILTDYNILNLVDISKEKLETYKKEYYDFTCKLGDYRKDYSLNIMEKPIKNEKIDEINKYMCGVIADKIVKL